MRQTKVYSILRQFSRIEQNRCRKYLQSPYFNKSETIVDLFELIVNDIQNGPEKEWEKEDIWQALALDNAFDDVRLRKYFSDLQKLVEGYLGQQVYDERAVQQYENLMEAISIKKLEGLENSVNRKALKALDKNQYRSSRYYLNHYLIDKQFYNLTQFDTKRSVRSNIDQMAENLDHFYLIEKLRFHTTVLMQKRIVNYDYSLALMDELVAYAKNEAENLPRNIKIFLRILDIYQDPENVDVYYAYKAELKNIQDLFPPDELIEIYSFGTNYCIQKINRGQSQFLNELFELYEKLIEMEVLFNQELSPWLFRNEVVVALRLGHYDWTESFIKKYAQWIPEAYRENAVTFNLATLYFYKKDYEEVIKLLRFVEYEDISYNLNSKTILLHTYFETDEIESLYSLFESFRVFLNRNKSISEPKKMDYKNLIKFTKKMTRIQPGDAKSLNKLKKDIDETNRLASRKWLLDKVEELL